MNFVQWPTCDKDLRLLASADCETLLSEAQTKDRKRSHLLLHDGHSDRIQRLIVAFCHGSYIQPHQHSEQWEMIIPLSGAFALLLFSDDGTVSRRTEITADGTSALEIPAGIWHALAPMSETALMIELKPGPFRAAEFSNLYPTESEAASAEVARWLLRAQVGERWAPEVQGYIQL